MTQIILNLYYLHLPLQRWHVFFMSSANPWRGDQTALCRGACCLLVSRSKIAKCPAIQFVLWYFTFWQIGQQMHSSHDVSQSSLHSSVSHLLALVPMWSAPLLFSFQPQIGVPTQGLCAKLCPLRPLEWQIGHQLRKQWQKNESGDIVSPASLTWLWSVLRN